MEVGYRGLTGGIPSPSHPIAAGGGPFCLNAYEKLSNHVTVQSAHE